jgi:hypothetical protein
MAISGEMPDRPFRMAERVLRLTPRAAAASVTVKPSGRKHSSRNTSPGWGGLCILMVTSVVVLVVHTFNIRSDKCKGDAPIPADGHGPGSLPRTSELMQVQAGEAHITRRRSHAQAAQNQPQPLGVFRLNPGLAAGREESFKALVPEGRDRHGAIVTRNGSRYKAHHIALHPSAAPLVLGGQGSALTPCRARMETSRVGPAGVRA